MIGRQPGGHIQYVSDPAPNTKIILSDRPLWNTDPILSTTAPTIEDYQEACQKIRELSKTQVGPWSSWKIILDLLPPEE